MGGGLQAQTECVGRALTRDDLDADSKAMLARASLPHLENIVLQEEMCASAVHALAQTCGDLDCVPESVAFTR